MTKDTDKPAPEKAPRIDFARPFFMTIRQTEHKNIVEVIDGDGSADHGLAELQTKVAADALRFKTTIAILGPQIGLGEPPKSQDGTFTPMHWGNV